MKVTFCILCLLLVLNHIYPVFNQVVQFEKDFHPSSDKKCSSPNSNLNRKPVVMIPGVLGTRLIAKLNKTHSSQYLCETQADWYSLWLNLEQLLPHVIDCWVDNIRMEYNNITRTVKNTEGVDIRAPMFGSTEVFEYLDSDHYAPGSKYFGPLVEHFVDIFGYTREKDLLGAPYDWRLSPRQHAVFLKNMTKLVEQAYYSNGNRKVVVIGHSMGCMFTYYWLKYQKQAWKNKFIDSYVSISGPYLGSVKAVKAVISGETEGHDYVLPRLKLRDAVRSSPAFPFMFPRPDMWPADKQVIVVTKDSNNYTVNDYKSLFKTVGCEWCWDLWRDNGMSLGSVKHPPSVPVHCIYSSQVPTPETLIYDENLFPDDAPSLVDGSGDGTVNVWSGSACLDWTAEQKEAVHKFEMPGNSHVAILWNSTLHHYLKSVVLL